MGLAKGSLVIPGQGNRHDQLIDGIVDQLRARLVEVLTHPQPGGKKITIHVAPDRCTAWIELPPEVVEVKTHR